MDRFLQSLLTDRQRALRERTEGLCRGRLGELDAAAGETDTVDRQVLACLAGEGLLDWTVPGAHGKDAVAPDPMSLVEFCLIRETLARHCPAAELIFAMQGLGSGPISFAGSAEQRARYLPRVAAGELVAAFALTEPETGSDVAALGVTARKEGDAYVLDGRKSFITMAPDADLYTVFATTDPDAGNKGISAFIVERGAPGFDPGPRMQLLAAHPIGEPSFDGCRVPESARIGREGGGFEIAMATLDFFRATVGASAVGMAEHALDEALAYARRRRAFGRPIGDFQAIRMKLAAMATELEAARLLVYRAAMLRDGMLRDGDRQTKITLESAQAKWYATEAAQRIIDEAVQIHGGRGVVKGQAVERLYREIRALRIYEGTSEIQQLIIGGHLLREESIE